jgi:DNA-binding NarL/FixJ family response regulator
MRRLKVLVVEDHPMMVEAIRLALPMSGQFEVSSAIDSGSQACAVAERTRPDVILLDLQLPDVDGLDVIRALVRAGNRAKIVVFSAHESPELVDRALRAGACAFITKRIDPSDLAAALRQALDQTLYQPRYLNQAPADPARDIDLDERELQILVALCDGLSNKEIAKSLWLGEQTVKFQLTRIYRKLGVSSRTEAVVAACENGVLDPAPPRPAAPTTSAV